VAGFSYIERPIFQYRSQLTRMPGSGSQSAEALEEEERLLSCNRDLSGLGRDAHHPGMFRQQCLRDLLGLQIPEQHLFTGEGDDQLPANPCHP
jgi:hypothetical protein